MKTKNPRQFAMDFDTPRDVKKPEVAHSVNYTEMALGTGAGYRKVIEACDECGLPGITKHNDQNFVWIHAEEIVITAKQEPRRQIITKCTVKR